MRWVVVINVHINQYPVKSAYFRHIFLLFDFAKIHNYFEVAEKSMQITIYLVLSANGQAEAYLCVNCTLLTFVCESTFFRTIQVNYRTQLCDEIHARAFGRGFFIFKCLGWNIL